LQVAGHTDSGGPNGFSGGDSDFVVAVQDEVMKVSQSIGGAALLNPCAPITAPAANEPAAFVLVAWSSVVGNLVVNTSAAATVAKLEIPSVTVHVTMLLEMLTSASSIAGNILLPCWATRLMQITVDR
jgi:hypothetical protein